MVPASNVEGGRTMPGLDDIKGFADDHDEQVDQALDKGGEAAGEKFGHADQIDKGVDWAQQQTGSGDSAGAEQQAPDEQN